MDFLEKPKIFLIAGAVVFITLLGSFLLIMQNKPSLQPEVIVQGQAEEIVPTPEPIPQIMVHMKGAIVHEGIYSLSENARLKDAIDAAGGLKDSADSERINLVTILYDGDEINIPDKNTVKEAPKTEVVTSSAKSRENLIKNSESAPTVPSIININTATAAELESLSGIGPATSKKIIEYREKTPFLFIEDIKFVNGIGEKKFEVIKDFICVE